MDIQGVPSVGAGRKQGGWHRAAACTLALALGLLVSAVTLGWLQFGLASAAPFACTELGIDGALAAGGSPDIDCHAPTTIVVTSTKVIALPVVLNGKGFLTVSGGGLRPVFSNNAGVNATLKNMTIISGAGSSGGGVINSGYLIVDNVEFNGNAALGGAAIYNDINATVLISGSRFFNNRGILGAVLSGNELTGTATSHITVVGSLFQTNTAALGAAIANFTGTLSVQSSTFISQTALEGAIYSRGPTTITASTFLSNVATNPPAGLSVASPAQPQGATARAGGAIFFYLNGDQSIRDSTFRYNASDQGGGAIVWVADAAGQATISGSLFDANRTNGGGGAVLAAVPLAVDTSAFRHNRTSETVTLLSGPNPGLSLASPQAPSGAAPGSGGAIFSFNQLTVTQSNFVSNTATLSSTFGGGAIIFAGSARITGSRFEDNHANNSGGAVEAAGNLTMADSTFIGNSAVALGGAIWQHFSPPPVSLLKNVAFENNAAGAGGAIALETGSLDAIVVTFNGNSAGGKGGAVDAEPVSTLHVDSSVLFGNQSGINNGGAIWSGGVTTILNSTISGNRSNFQLGGGIMVSGGSLLLTNTTFYSNSSTLAGGDLYAGVPATATNTIFALGYAGGSPQNCAGPMVSTGHNLDDGTSCGLTATGDISHTVALLGPLEFNGGPTPTDALLAGSPAIDHGSAAACPAKDQRGAVRPVDGDGVGGAVCDIGAFEYKGFVAWLYLPLARR